MVELNTGELLVVIIGTAFASFAVFVLVLRTGAAPYAAALEAVKHMTADTVFVDKMEAAFAAQNETTQQLVRSVVGLFAALTDVVPGELDDELVELAAEIIDDDDEAAAPQD